MYWRQGQDLFLQRGWQVLINAATFGILPARKFSICNRPRCAHLGKRRVHILPTPYPPTDKFQIVKDKTNKQKCMKEFGTQTHEIKAVKWRQTAWEASILSLIFPRPTGNPVWVSKTIRTIPFLDSNLNPAVRESRVQQGFPHQRWWNSFTASGRGNRPSCRQG